MARNVAGLLAPVRNAPKNLYQVVENSDIGHIAWGTQFSNVYEMKHVKVYWAPLAALRTLMPKDAVDSLVLKVAPPDSSGRKPNKEFIETLRSKAESVGAATHVQEISRLHAALCVGGHLPEVVDKWKKTKGVDKDVLRQLQRDLPNLDGNSLIALNQYAIRPNKVVTHIFATGRAP